MTQEIKERISKIQSGEIPDGYKKTKVGIMPREWKVEKIGKYFSEYKELSNDILHFPVFSSSRQGLIPQSQYYDKKEAVCTNLGYKMVPQGYVTYRHMSDDDIFHFNINENNYTVLVSSEYPVFSIKDSKTTSYILSCLNYSARFRYFCRMQKKGGTRTRLYYKNLCEYKIFAPSLPEQEKIAGILSTQDKVIELKGKKLEEKKKQKKYLMQTLVTGKTRLKGFNREWEKVELGTIFDYIQPTPYLVGSANYEQNADTPVLTAGKTFILGYTNETYGVFRNIPVVIFDDFTTASKYVDFPFKVKSSAIKILRCKDQYNIIFAFAALQNIKYPVGGHERHWISKFSNIPIKCPEFTEQTAIANILSTADKEIELLEKDLEQEKQKKKALMQYLLTGIVRVKV